MMAFVFDENPGVTGGSEPAEATGGANTLKRMVSVPTPATELLQVTVVDVSEEIMVLAGTLPGVVTSLTDIPATTHDGTEPNVITLPEALEAASCQATCWRPKEPPVTS